MTEPTEPAAAVVRVESPRPWRQRAACRGVGADDWYADGRRKDGAEALARARTTCRTCPVAVECLGDALTEGTSYRYGMRAGYLAHERAGLRLPPPPPAAPRPPMRGEPVGEGAGVGSWLADLGAVVVHAAAGDAAPCT